LVTGILRKRVQVRHKGGKFGFWGIERQGDVLHREQEERKETSTKTVVP
jgi:hypothetical protein